MAHEILTPAIAIRGTADRLRTKSNDGSFIQKYCQSYSQDIFDHAEMQIYLTRKVEFLRLTSQGGPKIKKYQMIDRYNLESDIISPSKKAVIPLARNNKLTFDKIIIAGSFPNLYIDKYAFQQVFFNLLTNAIKYRQDDSPESFKVFIGYMGSGTFDVPIANNDVETISAEFEIMRSDGFLIRVSDQGIGIDPEISTKIWLFGYRKPGIEEKDVLGLGLGLTVVQGILNDFGCSIWVSNPRNPTSFDIFLPRKLADKNYMREEKDWY
jgi:signal transduction histidine kinase